MPIATTTIVATGAAVGIVGVAVKNSRFLPGRRQRLVTLLRVEVSPSRDNPTRQQTYTAQEKETVLRALDNAYQALFQNYIDPLLMGKRHQDVNRYRLEHQTLEEAQVEYEINRHLGMTVTAAVAATLGALGMPGMLGVSVALGIYSSGYLFRKSYEQIVYERRIRDEFINLLAICGTLATGLYLANALTETGYFLGEKLLILTENRARSNLIDTWSQLPRSAWLLKDGQEYEVSVTDLQVGDQIVVQAGQVVPVDGVVLEGMAQIDQHMLTGEAQPVEKQPGDPVFAATLVFSGTIVVHVGETGKDTVALQITDILNNTLSHETQTHAQARRWADQWAPFSLGVGVLAATISPTSAVAVWNTSIGSNVKITAPIALLNYLNVALKSDIMIKDGRSIDLLRDVDTIVFDKTGTLTLEQPTLTTIHRFADVDEGRILTYAAAAERRQSHPIALAILQAAEKADLTIPTIRDAHYEIGYGIKVQVNGVQVQIGSRRYMAMNNVPLPPTSDDIQASCDALGHSLVYLALDGVLAGALELEPTIRPEAVDVVRQLREAGYDIMIISGDQEQPTRKLANQLGIPYYFANTLPQNKATLVEQLQAEGRSVCFVGDGINDGIALKKAHVSVSLRGATTVAMDAAQILLISKDLTALPTLFQMAHDYSRNIRAGYATTVLPGLAFVASIFAFGLGVNASMVAYNASTLSAVSISLSAGRHYRHSDQPQLPAGDEDTPELDAESTS